MTTEEIYENYELGNIKAGTRVKLESGITTIISSINNVDTENKSFSFKTIEGDEDHEMHEIDSIVMHSRRIEQSRETSENIRRIQSTTGSFVLHDAVQSFIHKVQTEKSSTDFIERMQEMLEATKSADELSQNKTFAKIILMLNDRLHKSLNKVKI